MKIHPLALSTLLAVASVISTDAFVVPFSRSMPMTSSRSEMNNGVLKILRFVVAEASPATTCLSMFESNEDYENYEENYEDYYEGVLFDAMETNDRWMYYSEEEAYFSSLTLAEADAPTIESTTPQQLSSETAATPGTALSVLAVTPGLSVGAVALGGLAVARGALGQRQKKLDEERRNLEEQQKRFEKESAKLQQDTSQNNLFLVSFDKLRN